MIFPFFSIKAFVTTSIIKMRISVSIFSNFLLSYNKVEVFITSDDTNPLVSVWWTTNLLESSFFRRRNDDVANSINFGSFLISFDFDVQVEHSNTLAKNIGKLVQQNLTTNKRILYFKYTIVFHVIKCRASCALHLNLTSSM